MGTLAVLGPSRPQAGPAPPTPEWRAVPAPTQPQSWDSGRTLLRKLGRILLGENSWESLPQKDQETEA